MSSGTLRSVIEYGLRLLLQSTLNTVQFTSDMFCVPFFTRATLCSRRYYSYGPVSVCVCLSQVGVLSKRQYEPRRFWHVSFLPPILHLENFTTASQSCCRQTCRRSSLLTTLTTWLNDGRFFDVMYTHLHTVYKLDRSALTPVL